MENREKAIELLVNFRNCKFNSGKRLSMADSGMNYVLMVLNDPSREFIAKDLAEEMNVSTARITTMIQKMEEKGYVERTVSEEDKRVSYIRLTELGKEESNRITELSIKIASRVLEQYGEEKVGELLAVIGGIKQILDEEM